MPYDKTRSWRLFQPLAYRYDRINTWLSWGRDRYWRKQLALSLPQKEGMHWLDIATGTGQQIVAAQPYLPPSAHVVGIDLSEEMLAVGRLRLSSKINLLHADAMALPFDGATYDVISVSFGLRNLTDPALALHHWFPLLHSGGDLLILEFSMPTNRWLRLPHHLYLRYLLPKIGGWLSGKPAAYHYLAETIASFPYGASMCRLMEEAGYCAVEAMPMTGGAVTLYRGRKP
ncbi:MAG: ubiquinone/menaquinone biosynthesis methyltransferase [Chlamydiota bacterium]|nr:ubiquinone/menaquinone biosynthesis methyltransferase [Chlamydiota bacterium]